MKTFRVDFTEHSVGYVLIKADTKEEAQSIFETTDVVDLRPRYTDSTINFDEIKEQ